MTDTGMISERPANSSPDALSRRLRAVIEALAANLVERDDAVRLAVLTTLAGEHLLLIGPPGTAKSEVARRLRHAICDATYFERLLTRFTVPEELFGPLSIQALENDRYVRQTDGYLPQAAVAFLDEIFKANSAILNALLTLLNERQFDNGTVREDTPLVAVIGASNELPETGAGAELGALYDRFLLRLEVPPVSDAGFAKLLRLDGDGVGKIAESDRISPELLTWVQTNAALVEVPEDVLALLESLRTWCEAEHIYVSDRRWKKIVKLLRVAAWTNGRDEVTIWDCWLLQHCLWEKPEQRGALNDWYARRVGSNAAMDPERLTRLVTSYEGRLELDRTSQSQARDGKGRLLYRNHAGQRTTKASGSGRMKLDTKLLFLAPPHWMDGRGNEMTERTNSGQYFTEEQLDSDVRVAGDGQHYGWQPFVDWHGRKAYLQDENNKARESGAHAAVLEPMRFSVAHIDAKVAEIVAVQQRVDDYREGLEGHMESLDASIRNNLWVDDRFVRRAWAALNETRGIVGSLSARIDALKEGFAGLPVIHSDVPLRRPKEQ